MRDKEITIKNNTQFDANGLGEIRPGKRPMYQKLAILLAMRVLAFILGYIVSGGSGDRRLALLEEENSLLRAKIELYAATVDSIYNMLDSLGIKSANPPNPELYRGGASMEPDHSRDPKLKLQMENLEQELVKILWALGPHLPADTTPDIFAEPIEGDIPSIYPTFGRISDHYGTRIHPITKNMEFHYGIDFANETGTPIYASAAGIVLHASYLSGYGKRIVLDHGNGYQSVYAHLYSSKVKKGDVVKKGQIIALMGNSGLSTGPHLHYEVHYHDRKMNPANYLNRSDRYALR
ncbi:MAG: M23 family metallopeptidase [Candidatus Cloacimonetes bacterium]|nr:M23 family metallopeptidase [Candidatus Cloacimonadota bacterium]